MSEKFQNITQASDWEDWKKTCAYLNCSSESQSRLGDFGVSRMLNWLESVKGMKGIFLSSENCKSEAWHWLDVHIIQKDSRGGTRIGGAKEAKASKDWLFDCEGLVTVEDIEKYFTKGFFRAAAQEYARSNRSSSISLDQPISNSEKSITLEEQLDDGNINISEELILKELLEFLSEIVSDEFDSSKEETKIAILGSALELSLDNDTIKELTDRGKSALYDRVKSANSKVLEKTKAHPNFHEHDVNDKTLNLALEALLKKKSEEWGRNPENPASVLFDIA